jgi:phosphate transport system protein
VIVLFNFKELIELWRSDNLLKQALNDSHTMLEHAQAMFQESVRSLRDRNEAEGKINVYVEDIQINTYQREVRKKVLKHLAITGGANIIPGLILTSIVIDIERLGDYTKNIMDLAIAHPKKLTCSTYEEQIGEIETGTMELFDKVIPTVKETNKEEAQKLIEGYWWILKKCDEILTQLIQETEEDAACSTGNAVTTALYARYLKRMSAHLLNICTSVVNPFEAISYYQEND